VAALTLVLASRFTTLSKDHALLAGLLHDIGKLPVMTYAERFPELLADPKVLAEVSTRIHCPVGRIIMKTWKLPEELVAVAAEHENVTRDSPMLDYTDLVIIANIFSHRDSDHALAAVDWNTVPAIKKLGLTGETAVEAIGMAEDEVQSVYNIMAG